MLFEAFKSSKKLLHSPAMYEQKLINWLSTPIPLMHRSIVPILKNSRPWVVNELFDRLIVGHCGRIPTQKFLCMLQHISPPTKRSKSVSRAGYKNHKWQSVYFFVLLKRAAQPTASAIQRSIISYRELHWRSFPFPPFYGHT
jgi:hypothetical protein